MPDTWYCLERGAGFRLVLPPSSSPLLRLAGAIAERELTAAGLARVPARQPAGLELRLGLVSFPAVHQRFEQLGLRIPHQPEAYSLATTAQGPAVVAEVAGSDPAGVLYGTGRLVRSVLCYPNEVALPAGLRLSAHPWHSPGADGEPGMRGQQIAINRYRFLWTREQWEDCVRELALWGNNWIWVGIGSDLAHAGSCPEALRRSARQAKLLNLLARLAGKYGMKFGMHLCGQRVDPSDVRPGMTPQGRWLLCPSLPEAREAVLRAQDYLYRRLERVDGIFTASGDPGGCRCPRCDPWPAAYLRMAAEQARVLRKHHPQARYYLSNQQMRKEENEVFFRLLETEQPEWLDGVLWGPQSRSLPEMRERIPERYQVLLYPDTTHTARCQNPVAGWEGERALFFERASPNYRPLATRELWEKCKGYCNGSKPYSEGVHDDLNKAVWSASQWIVASPAGPTPLAGPEPVAEIVRQYAQRYFGAQAGEQAAALMLACERNWSLPLLDNEQVAANLAHLRARERRLPAARRNSWRWQMLAIRVEMDRWLQLKVAADRKAYAAAVRALGRPGELAGRLQAARRRLQAAPRGAQAQKLAELRKAITARHERLQELIRVDLSAPRRMDLDFGDRAWLQARLAAIEQAPAQDQERLVAKVCRYRDPGPGGCYDDCGNPQAEPHLVAGEDYFMEEMAPANRLSHDSMSYGRSEWDAEVVYLYQGLDPAARYRVELTYVTAGRMPSTQELLANGLAVHGPVTLPVEVPERHSYDLPPASYAGGWVELCFRRVSGRGPLVSEIWLRRVD